MALLGYSVGRAWRGLGTDYRDYPVCVPACVSVCGVCRVRPRRARRGGMVVILLSAHTHSHPRVTPKYKHYQTLPSPRKTLVSVGRYRAACVYRRLKPTATKHETHARARAAGGGRRAALAFNYKSRTFRKNVQKPYPKDPLDTTVAAFWCTRRLLLGLWHIASWRCSYLQTVSSACRRANCRKTP